MRYKKIEGFRFLKVADAFLSQVALQVDSEAGAREWHSALDILYPEVLRAEQSCYLVYLDDEAAPVYVGSYSGIFEDHWLKNDKYLWNEVLNARIDSALKAGRQVSVWLSVDPYAQADGRQLNISRTIAQIIIEAAQPAWNAVSESGSDQSHLTVAEICARYHKALPEVARSVFVKFSEQGLDAFHAKLMSQGSKSWGELQSNRLTELSRCRHFLDYVASGVAPDRALQWVWKEFP